MQIIIQIDCARLEVMKINLNHFRHLYKRFHEPHMQIIRILRHLETTFVDRAYPRTPRNRVGHGRNGAKLPNCLSEPTNGMRRLCFEENRYQSLDWLNPSPSVPGTFPYISTTGTNNVGFVVMRTSSGPELSQVIMRHGKRPKKQG